MRIHSASNRSDRYDQICNRENNETTTFLSELSFATVVFFGLTLTQTLELKKLQGDFHSFRVKLLIEAFVLHLIVAVVTLSLVVLYINGVKVNITILKPIQLWLFSFSIMWLFIIYFHKVSLEKMRSILNETISRKEYYNYLNQSLIHAKDHLSYVSYAFQRKNEIKANIENEDYENSEQYIKEMEYNFDK